MRVFAPGQVRLFDVCWQLSFIVCLLMIAGCGTDAPPGPDRFPVSGSVTFEGQPVPAGEIFFEPDAEKGNSGPVASTTFREGEYSLDADSGHVGGAMIVRVIGYDGKPPDGPEAEMNPHGMQLFPPYRTQIELPADASTRDIDVPRTD